ELHPQFAGNSPEDAGAAGVVIVVEQHQGVTIEAHVAAVFAAGGNPRADDHALDHVAGLDLTAGQRLLHAGLDDVAQVSHAALVAAEYLDAHHFLGTRVIR